MVGSKRPSAKFWDRIAARYSKKPVADEAAYQKKLQITRKYLRPDSRVLEFGCGTGSTAIAHAAHVKHVLADLKRVCPDYDEKAGYDLRGFVWFQGWNDMVDRGTYPQRDKPGGYAEYSNRRGSGRSNNTLTCSAASDVSRINNSSIAPT